MAGIHAEEVNRLKAGLFRSYHRTVNNLTMEIGPTGPPEDLFAELENVCPQSRPVNRRL